MSKCFYKIWLLFTIFTLLIAVPDVVAQTSKNSIGKPIRDKWAVVIGVSKFQDNKINLRYPAKDAKDFYKYLVTEANFAKDHVLLLTDKDATRLRILSALGDKWLPRLANPDDLVVIYISSHGSPADIDVGGLNYIIAHDTNLDCLYGTGIPLQNLMRIIKSRVHSNRVVLILDACHSGAASAESKGLFRSGNVDASQMAAGTGQLVIASSKPNQVSWEGKQYPNSVFTYHLIKALRMNANQTSLGQAFESMKDSIQEEVLRDRGKLQTPELKSKWSGEALVLSTPPTRPRKGMAEPIPKVFRPSTVSAIEKTQTLALTTNSTNFKKTSKRDTYDINTLPAIPPVTILNNGNSYKVFNKPSSSTTFSISYPGILTYLYTYHWNNGLGAPPGTIALRHKDGTIYGPWRARGKSGQSNVQNAYWEIEPIVRLKPGTYKIIDSNPETWAQNSGSRGAGFARVRVAPLVATTDPITGSKVRRSPEKKIFSNNNKFRVFNNPKVATNFSIKVTTLITKITSYHWNNSHGQRPGKITLVHNDGARYGPWQCNGRSGQAGAPEVYWDCMVDIVLKPGRYTVLDSDNITWSQNAQSKGAGIISVYGVYQY